MFTLPAPLLAIGFALVGVLAAGPVSAWLAAATWPQRRPTPALVLWQAVCLCAGLSLIGGALVAALAPLGDDVPSAVITLARNTFDGRPLDGLAAWRVLLLGGAVLFAGALLGVLVRSVVLILRRRRAHRQLLDLLTASPAASLPEAALGGLLADVRILDYAIPMAYSVPGWHTRLVLTAGLLDLVTDEQLAAIIAHERAHLRAHHELLLLPFQSWAAALGALPGVSAARRAVATLAEMQADDVAARRTHPQAVASGLAAVALATADRLALSSSELPDVASTAVVARVRRLQHPQPLGTAGTLAVLAAAAALLLVPTLLLVVGWT